MGSLNSPSAVRLRYCVPVANLNEGRQRVAGSREVGAAETDPNFEIRGSRSDRGRFYATSPGSAYLNFDNREIQLLSEHLMDRCRRLSVEPLQPQPKAIRCGFRLLSEAFSVILYLYDYFLRRY